VLAGRLGAALLDQDVATQPLVEVVQGLVGLDDLDDQRLAGLTRAARYEVLAALAVDNLAAGVPVVLVAPYTAERGDPQAWHDLNSRLRAAGGRPLLVWLSLPAAELRRRLLQRGAARDRAKLLGGPGGPGGPGTPGGLDRLAGLGTIPVVPHLALSAQLPTEALAERVLAELAIDGKAAAD
jgi:hypothetical protein